MGLADPSFGNTPQDAAPLSRNVFVSRPRYTQPSTWGEGGRPWQLHDLGQLFFVNATGGHASYTEMAAPMARSMNPLRGVGWNFYVGRLYWGKWDQSSANAVNWDLSRQLAGLLGRHLTLEQQRRRQQQQQQQPEPPPKKHRGAS